MTFYKKITADDVLVMALDDKGNYSIASERDPEPSAYTNHHWGTDTAEWHEITEEEAQQILEKGIRQ